MLSVCKVLLRGEDYYLSTAASGRDHAEGLVEAKGVWLGGGARQLGLIGLAEAGGVRRVLRGTDPVTGVQLLDDPTRRRIAAFDCTFSSPKSVSLLHAFTPDEAVREQVWLGHDAAVRASLDYLEQEACVVRVSGVDGRRQVRGEGLVGVGFLHRLSRAGDPHLHTHVLVANVASDRGEGGHPLDATALYRACRAAGALYETHLRYELTVRLGVEWQPLQGRCWSDLMGLDGGVLREFSQRTLQIREGVELAGWQGPAAHRAMAELTRPPKDLSRRYEDVIDDARPRLWKAGVTDKRLEQLCHRRSVAPGDPAGESGWAVVESWRADVLAWLPARTVDGTFTMSDVIRARCASARDGRTAAGVQEDARVLLLDDRVLERGERAMRLRGGASGSIPVGHFESLYTTRDIVDAEEQVVGLVRALASAGTSSITVVGYEPGRRFEALASLSVAAAAWNDEARTVVAVAPGRWAASGIESCCGIDTVAVPGVAYDRGRRATQSEPSGSAGAGLAVPFGAVVVVAEAQAYGPEALRRIMGACTEAQASVVVLAPRSALEHRRMLSEVASMAEGRLPAAPEAERVRATVVDHRRFGLVDVAVVGSLSAALEEAARYLRSPGGAADAGAGPSGGAGAAAGGDAERNPGRTARESLVVAGDEAVVAALRAMPGVEAGAVVHSRELKPALAERASQSTHLVILGGASVLRQGATAAPNVQRSHVLIAPGIDLGQTDGVGRAAEAARPRYLTSELGAPPTTVEGRVTWRAGAVAIEAFRDRWQISDGRHTYGVPSSSLSLSSELIVQQAAELADVSRQASEVRNRGRGREVRVLDGPQGLGLGRGR